MEKLILESSKDEDYGYMFECAPKELHNELIDLLLAPEYYNNRLFTILLNKEDVVHSRNLKYY